MVPTPLPTLLTKLALRSRVAAEVVTKAGRKWWHEVVNQFDNRPADNVGRKTADEVDSLAPVTKLMPDLVLVLVSMFDRRIMSGFAARGCAKADVSGAN